MVCTECGAQGVVIDLDVGKDEKSAKICEKCFDKEMIFRMNRNLVLQDYKYPVFRWDELTDSRSSDITESMAESVVLCLKNETVTEFIDTIIPMLPAAVGQQLCQAIASADAMYSALTAVCARMVLYLPRETVMSEVLEALDGWEIHFGTVFTTKLAHISGGKEFAAKFLKNLRTEIMRGIAEEFVKINPRAYMSRNPKLQEEEEDE